jgi:AraC-like DNA-binding protein
MMRYTVHAPPPALRRTVECLWHVQGDGAGAPPETIVPDGCIELIVHAGDPFLECGPVSPGPGAGGPGAPQPRVFVAGQLTRALAIRPGARLDTWGVRFRPGGAAACLGPDLERLASCLVPFEDLWGRAGRSEADRLLEHREGAAGLRRALEVLLLRRLAGGPGVDALAEAAAQRILRERGAVTVDVLAADAGVGRRQLERRFRSAVGLPPRALLRIARFQNLFRLYQETSRPAWADLALAAGYYDQAHLVNDFRELAGTTPPRFLAAQGELSRRFTERRRLQALFDV